MGLIHLPEYPNLRFDKEPLAFMESLKTEKDRRKVLKLIKNFDVYGYSQDILGNHVEYVTVEPYRGLIELKEKISSKREVRFLIVKAPKGSPRHYLVLHAFIKRTQKLSKRDLDRALNVAKREDYL
ncbi:hypothetical protein HBP98_16795 [Listeria booriae]|uniref:Uncharacterized protein n=1 Tax=Listeria booriae TaxID=1552123 RepID=A0A7X1AAW4_9LIST|nr:type II toxin-antitoxin system RelE/ParE family toxin [Listeria booriae]MBC2373671.1 hypothetical protein [Listeria booriae]